MSDKALLMLKHMRVQIRMQILIQGTRAASVWRAARSIGLKPEEGEFDTLLKELLRGGYIEPYPSPSLAAHGLYRLTDRGISAADEADSPTPLRSSLRRVHSAALGGGGCLGGDVGPKTMQLLKAMRGQLGDASASRSVDAVAAAEGLGMDTATHDFDRRLQDLVRAGYLEPDPNSAAPAARGLYRITFAGLDAADSY